MKLYCLVLLVFVQCTTKQKKSSPIVAVTHQQATSIADYETTKQSTKRLFVKLQISKTDTQIFAFEKYLVDSLCSQWYGTPWNFNGTTTIPNKGSIACGYFVTTILQHAGCAIDRVKLAQKVSSSIIKQTCINISQYSNKPIEYFVEEIKHKGKGLYIVGLDCHTGFIYFDGEEVYFIHANYGLPRCVLKEIAATSSVLTASKYKMVGKVNWIR
jgi:hypothetical protein